MPSIRHRDYKFSFKDIYRQVFYAEKLKKIISMSLYVKKNSLLIDIDHLVILPGNY